MTACATLPTSILTARLESFWEDHYHLWVDAAAVGLDVTYPESELADWDGTPDLGIIRWVAELVAEKSGVDQPVTVVVTWDGESYTFANL